MVEMGSNKKRILVVDDMHVHRELVSKLLHKAKYSVILAQNGEEAISYLKQNKNIDLVLLDVEMPGISGFEVCQFMRNDTILKELPVIFLTSYGQIENKVSGFGFGAQDFVTKPFNNRELLVRVKTHLLLKHKSDIIKNINNTLEEKNKDINDSIAYAKNIQQALLPSFKILDKLIKDRFLIFKPKELIGGDFYWFKQYGNILYIAIADCTGHGVPGALMSVLGITILNEVTKDHTIFSAGKILDELKPRLIKALNHNNKTAYTKDGMDMALCVIDFGSLTLQYAGANIPLFIMRKNESIGLSELIKRSPDRMPIGIYPNAKNNFTNYVIDLHENDRLYLFTDGYTSQFGGDEDKTFKTKRLIELFKSIQHLGFKEQKLMLEKSLLAWKGKREQVDDILGLGIQIQKNHK